MQRHGGKSFPAVIAQMVLASTGNPVIGLIAVAVADFGTTQLSLRAAHAKARPVR